MNSTHHSGNIESVISNPTKSADAGLDNQQTMRQDGAIRLGCGAPLGAAHPEPFIHTPSHCCRYSKSSRFSS